MAVDINEEVKAWGGFSVNDFWIGVFALVGITVFALYLTLRVSGVLAALWEATAGGGFMALWVYRLSLPKGYLLRRFRQEGKFLFIHFPWIETQKTILPPSYNRGARFAAEFGTEGQNEKAN